MKIRIPAIVLACILIQSCGPVAIPYGGGPSYPREQVSRVPMHRPEAPLLKRVKKRYHVEEDWTVELNGRRWIVPAGYSSNGITAPAEIRKKLGDGVARPETWAAVFHDWLFKQPGVSRQEADSTFHELLLAYGVPRDKARLMYTTVSLYSISKRFR